MFIKPASDTDWMLDSACRNLGMAGDMFFPGEGGRGQTGKRLCRNCPVATECLNYALTHELNHGIWGGMTDHERQLLRGEDS